MESRNNATLRLEQVVEKVTARKENQGQKIRTRLLARPGLTRPRSHSASEVTLRAADIVPDAPLAGGGAGGGGLWRGAGWTLRHIALSLADIVPDVPLAVGGAGGWWGRDTGRALGHITLRAAHIVLDVCEAGV